MEGGVLMKKNVKFTCSKLSEGFISECEVENIGDFENPNLFQVTTVYNRSCPLYQLGECPSLDCVLAQGEVMDYYIHSDPDSVDRR